VVFLGAVEMTGMGAVITTDPGPGIADPGRVHGMNNSSTHKTILINKHKHFPVSGAGDLVASGTGILDPGVGIAPPCSDMSIVVVEVVMVTSICTTT